MGNRRPFVPGFQGPERQGEEVFSKGPLLGSLTSVHMGEGKGAAIGSCPFKRH